MDSPIGALLLCADETGLTRVCFHTEADCKDEHPVLLQAQHELEEYFAGRRKLFSVPLSMQASEFCMQVWKALREIPYGEFATYGEIAARCGNRQAARAVGMACNRNPIPILVPCHRVVGAGGRLTGYAGGLEIKRILLEIEHNGR